MRKVLDFFGYLHINKIFTKKCRWIKIDFKKKFFCDSVSKQDISRSNRDIEIFLEDTLSSESNLKLFFSQKLT